MIKPFHRNALRSAALAFVCFASPIVAAPIQPLDIFELESAEDPQISPQGGTVVYVRSTTDIFTDTKHKTLWSIDVDGENHRPLTRGKRNDADPRWSPSGDRIGYVAASEKGQMEIRVRHFDTGAETVVAVLAESPSGLAWSPDGSQLAFIMVKPSAAPRIADMPSPPQGAKWAPPAFVTQQFVYRVDKVGYLEPGAQHLFIVSSKGGEPREVAQVSPPETRWARVAFDWDPSGESIVFSAMRNPRLDRPEDTHIYEVILATGEVRSITQRVGPDDEPKVSPDGRHIAYIGLDDHYRSSQKTRYELPDARPPTALYVMDRDGMNQRALTIDLDRGIDALQWAADSKGLFVMYDDRGMTTLAYVALNGDREVLTDKLGRVATAYTFGASFSVADNGRYAFTTAGPDYTGEISTGQYGAAGTKRITDVNDDLLGERALGGLEEILYKSKDDLTIQGWFVYPPDFDASRKYPLIVELHGAPTAYGPRFDIEKQLMAAAGYIVLYINYRGSTSYGESFLNIGYHDYPADEYYDIVAGVDAAIAKGNVDESRLYLAGGSGGGVLTAWTIARTDRFRAAASYYPVIEWTSMALTTDTLADGVMTRHSPGAPWEVPEHYRAHSLLTPVANVKTPTILIVGAEDYRTPDHQAEQYYRALKWLGVEAAFVRVPDEGHGINHHPSHKLSKVLHTLGWFEKHK